MLLNKCSCLPLDICLSLLGLIGDMLNSCSDNMFNSDLVNIFTRSQANLFTSDSSNKFHSDFANMFTSASANMFTSASANMFTSDLANMFTSELEKCKKMIWPTCSLVNLTGEYVSLVPVIRHLIQYKRSKKGYFKTWDSPLGYPIGVPIGVPLYYSIWAS